MACRLGLEHLYRPIMCFVNIKIGKLDYILAVSHGIGSKLKTEKFALQLQNVDVLMVAHTHDANIKTLFRTIVDITKSKIRTIPIRIITLTGWLEIGGYGLKNLFTPQGILYQHITLYQDKKRISYFDIDNLD